MSVVARPSAPILLRGRRDGWLMTRAWKTSGFRVPPLNLDAGTCLEPAPPEKEITSSVPLVSPSSLPSYFNAPSFPCKYCGWKQLRAEYLHESFSHHCGLLWCGRPMPLAQGTVVRKGWRRSVPLPFQASARRICDATRKGAFPRNIRYYAYYMSHRWQPVTLCNVIFDRR